MNKFVKGQEISKGYFDVFNFPKKTSPKGSSASNCDVGNWIFSKLGTF